MLEGQDQSLIAPNSASSDAKDQKEVKDQRDQQGALVVLSTRRMVINNLTKTTLPLMIVGSLGATENFIRVNILSSFGGDALAVDALNGMTFGLLLSSDSGFLNPASALIAQAFGEGKKQEIGKIVQQAWLLGAVLSVPTITIMWFSESLLNLFGQSPELTKMVGPYARTVSLASPGIYWMYVDTTLLRATKKAHTLIPLYLVSAMLGAGVSFLLVEGNLGFPRLGIIGSGYATIVQVWACWVGLKVYFCTRDFSEYHLYKFRQNNFDPLKKMVKYGAPMFGLALGEQVKLFLTGMMMGWLGKTELSVNQASNAYLQFFISPILGIRQASQIYVSQFKGKKDYINMRRFGNLGIYLEAALNTIPLIAYTVVPLQLASVFMPEAEVEEMETFIRLVFVTKALSRIIESIQGSTVENLKGLLDTHFSSLVQILTSLAAVVPLSYLFGFVWGGDLYGINAAAAVGVGISIPPLLWRWYKLSKPTEDLSHLLEGAPNTATPRYQSLAAENGLLLETEPMTEGPLDEQEPEPIPLDQPLSPATLPLYVAQQPRNSHPTVEALTTVSEAVLLEATPTSASILPLYTARQRRSSNPNVEALTPVHEPVSLDIDSTGILPLYAASRQRRIPSNDDRIVLTAQRNAEP